MREGTKKLVKAVIDGIAPVFRNYVHKHIEIAIEPLRARIKELESCSFEYRDEWKGATAYSKHNSVTHDGSMWIAKQGNMNVRPGTDPSVWKLCVKRGSIRWRKDTDADVAGVR